MLSGTFDLFSLAEVLGLVERATASGALAVRGRKVDGTLYFADGEFSAGEAADFSGPVDDQSALEIRILEVCVLLLRSGPADFEFHPGVTPPWPAALATPVGPTLERAAAIAREWPSIMTAVESFESQLERTGEITAASVTLSSMGFRLFELIDGRSTIRDLARRAQASLIIVAPEVRSLILAGAVRVLADPVRALATASADVAAEYDQAAGAVVELTELAPMTTAVEPIHATAHAPVMPIHAAAHAPVMPIHAAAHAPVEPAHAAAHAPVMPAHAAAHAPVEPAHAAAHAPVMPIHAAAHAPVEPAHAAVQEHASLSAPAPSVETMQPASDPAEFARDRAELASRAGLTDPGPVPQSPPPADDMVAAPERAQIVVDRSDLLRMFSGLKEE